MTPPFLRLMHRLPTPIKSQLRAVRRTMGSSPIQQVFAELQRRGTPVRQACVLEVFGGDGDLHLKDYVHLVSDLEVWERDPSLELRLRTNVPSAQITIGDSFQLIKQTPRRYDIVVVDNPTDFSATPIELFVSALEKVTDEPVFIFNVITDIRPEIRRAWPALQELKDVEGVLERRRLIFRTETPEYVPLERMTAVYAQLARALDFELQWSFWRQRHYGEYLVFRLKRLTPLGDRGAMASANLAKVPANL